MDSVQMRQNLLCHALCQLYAKLLMPTETGKKNLKQKIIEKDVHVRIIYSTL